MPKIYPEMLTENQNFKIIGVWVLQIFEHFILQILTKNQNFKKTSRNFDLKSKCEKSPEIRTKSKCQKYIQKF